MINDDQFSDALGHALHNRAEAISPPADLADRIIRQRHRGRRRSVLALTGTIISVVVVAIVIILAGQAPGSSQLGSARLQLASYSFKLPRGARVVGSSATPAACAIGAGIVYVPAAGEGASAADQPTIAQAVTSNGGCVSMLLTDPYTPGAANAPHQPFTVVDQHAVQIGPDTGTVGTYQIIGSGMTFHGVPVPSGTEHVALTLQLPASGGQTQDLQVAVAGISEQQLVSIVSSGLTAQTTSPN